jgi:hypothetical protein
VSKILVKNCFFFILILLSLSYSKSSQAQGDDLVKLSGIVLRLDSVRPIAYANISVKNTTNGTISDKNGLFSIEIGRTDTVIFSSIGSETVYYVLPDTLKGNSYSMIQGLPIDTISLRTVEVTSWPSLNAFNEAFTEEYGYEPKIEPYDPSKIDQQKIAPSTFQRDQYRIAGNSYSYMYENAHIPVKDVLNPKRWKKLVKKVKTGTY